MHLQETQETWVLSLDQEDLLEEEMATHLNILAWTIQWTEEPGGLKSMGSQSVRHDWAHARTHTHATFPGILKSPHLRASRPVNCTDFVQITWI